MIQTSSVFRPLRWTAFFAGCLLLAGCTFEPGEPWGYIDAELTAETIVAESDDVEFDDRYVAFGDMELRAPGGTTDGVEDFDPSDPPAGFTLCHQGHCHHEDGDIYTYEEIEEGIGVDSEGPTNVSRRDLETGDLDLSRSVSVQQQFRVLEETNLNEVAVAVAELGFEATVETDDGPRVLDVTLAMPTRFLTTGIAYEIGADAPEHQPLRLALRWPDDLLADLDELDTVLEESDDDFVQVHGTSHPELREVLVERIVDRTEIEWTNHSGPDSD